MTSARRPTPYRPNDEEFLRCPEAGRRLEIRTADVYRLIDDGVLRFPRDDRGFVRVPASDVEEYRRRRSA
jgi:excisionase family DNA binding protein